MGQERQQVQHTGLVATVTHLLASLMTVVMSMFAQLKPRTAWSPLCAFQLMQHSLTISQAVVPNRHDITKTHFTCYAFHKCLDY